MRKPDFSTKKTLLSLLLTISVIWLHTRLPQGSGAGFTALVLTHNNISARCSVMVFFVMSGYLFARGAQSDNVRAKMRRRVPGLLAPYLVWNVLYTLYYHAGALVQGGYDPARLLEDVLLARAHPPAWYVLYLLVFTALGVPILAVMRRRAAGLAALLALPVLQAALFAGGFLPGLRLDGCFYYLLGCWLALHAQRAVETPSQKKSLLAAGGLASCALLAAAALHFNIAPVAAAALVGCWLCVWFALDAVPLPRLPRALGGVCFLAYMAHTLLLELLNRALETMGLRGAPAAAIAYLGGPCLVLGACALAQKTLCRVPWVGVALAGGRTEKREAADRHTAS